ncbi:TRAP transporter large permease [Sneathiella aquimaris]|uniref:TRAP transporter large permease n=1 Tax=Sneathiella aquimaris TaxID=2599305 RepID=UPI00146E86B2|nr:TRAP transporter large permease [Sneathiella aquimaris]
MILALFIILLLIGLPIAIVVMTTAIGYILNSGNFGLFDSLPQQLFGGIESYGLLAIPLFMLAGEFMNEGGLTKRLVAMASVFVSGFKGGLAYVNLIANMMMASIMGSAVAQIAVMSNVMVPEMEKKGYDRAYAGALTAAGGLMSPIIPPSMLFVIYGVLAQIPIGDMFIAGVVPGLMMGTGFILVVALLGFKYNYPKSAKITLSEARSDLLMGLPSLIIPVVIIGGILLGIATPTESASIAVVAALVIGKYVYKELQFRNFGTLLFNTALNSSAVIFMVAGANLLGWALIFEQLPQTVAAWLAALSDDPLVFLLLVNLALLLVGMVIDGIAALVMVVPILLPIAVNVYGIDPYHFGVIVCLNLVLGLLTPPVGSGLFVAASMSRVPPTAIFKALLPFLAMSMFILLLLIWQPWLVTALQKAL